jgi:hypothetical protein
MTPVSGRDHNLAGHRVAGRPDAMPDLRYHAPLHIVPMYQLDISGRRLAGGRFRRELR